MKQEERLENLFEAARKESPQTSYEILAKKFRQSNTTSAIETIRQLFSKSINMNSFFLLITIGFIGTLSYFSLTPSIGIIEQIVDIPKDIDTTVSFSPNISKIELTELNDKEAYPLNQDSNTENTFVKKAGFEKQALLVEPTILSINTETTSFISPKTRSIFIVEKMPAQEKSKVESVNKHIPQELQKPKIYYRLIELDWQDDKKQILRTKQAIQDLGFEVKRLNAERKKEDIYKVILHLEHAKGLDWKFTVKDFKKIELRLSYDNKNGLTALAYRFNQEGKFSKPIKLTDRSVSKHRVSEGTKGRHITRKKIKD